MSETLDVMPFGKHAGEPFSDLPEDYLDWLLENLDPDDQPAVVEAAEREREQRA